MYQEVVLHLRAGANVISVIKQNPPYYLMVDLDKVSTGRSTSTAIEPVLDTLYNLLLNYQLLRSRLTDLNQLIADLVRPERVATNQFLL